MKKILILIILMCINNVCVWNINENIIENNIINVICINNEMIIIIILMC